MRAGRPSRTSRQSVDEPNGHRASAVPISSRLLSIEFHALERGISPVVTAELSRVHPLTRVRANGATRVRESPASWGAHRRDPEVGRPRP